MSQKVKMLYFLFFALLCNAVSSFDECSICGSHVPPKNRKFYATVNNEVNDEFNGKVNGEFYGINGEFNGTIYGEFNGEVNGQIWGNVKGEVNGRIKGKVWGEVNGKVNAEVNAYIVGKVNGRIKDAVYGKVKGQVSHQDVEIHSTRRDVDTASHPVFKFVKAVKDQNEYGVDIPPKMCADMIPLMGTSFCTPGHNPEEAENSDIQRGIEKYQLSRSSSPSSVQLTGELLEPTYITLPCGHKYHSTCFAELIIQTKLSKAVCSHCHEEFPLRKKNGPGYVWLYSPKLLLLLVWGAGLFNLFMLCYEQKKIL